MKSFHFELFFCINFFGGFPTILFMELSLLLNQSTTTNNEINTHTKTLRKEIKHVAVKDIIGTHLIEVSKSVSLYVQPCNAILSATLYKVVS